MSKFSEALRHAADLYDEERGLPLENRTGFEMISGNAPKAGMPVDFGSRKSFLKETVYLNEIIGRGAPMIDGITFERCRIMGPAFIKFHNHCTVSFCTLGPLACLTPALETTAIHGAIFLSGCKFTQCYFDTISVIDTPKGIQNIQLGFDHMDLPEWKRRAQF